MKSIMFSGSRERGPRGDLVYDRLLQEILSGRFECGDELKEVVLAREHNISRTPVREALRRLAADGLVRNSLNQRAVVTRFTRQEVVETYGVRKILEAAAAELAAERLGDKLLSELRRLAKRATGRRS